MFLPRRSSLLTYYLLPTGAALIAGPARAAAGAGAATFGEGLVGGDMAAVQPVVCALTGLIALLGLWFLVHRPRVDEAIRLGYLEVQEEAAAPEAAQASPPDTEADRPTRLLEAIAAVKAQMAISEAEKKHED